MQQLQAHRASIITAMVAAAILTFAGLAPAPAQAAERVVNGGTEAQAASLPVPSAHRYRAAQWLLDLFPEAAPNTGDDEFADGDDMIFLSIFWMSYIPIVIVILWLIGDWLTQRFRKLGASFSAFISTHVQAELRTATSLGGPIWRLNSAPEKVLRSNAYLKHRMLDKETSNVQR